MSYAYPTCKWRMVIPIASVQANLVRDRTEGFFGLCGPRVRWSSRLLYKFSMWFSNHPTFLPFRRRRKDFLLRLSNNRWLSWWSGRTCSAKSRNKSQWRVLCPISRRNDVVKQILAVPTEIHLTSYGNAMVCLSTHLLVDLANFDKIQIPRLPQNRRILCEFALQSIT